MLGGGVGGGHMDMYWQLWFRELEATEEGSSNKPSVSPGLFQRGLLSLSMSARSTAAAGLVLSSGLSQ